MKKILVVEGIATSGKTSLIKEILDLVGRNDVRVFGEAETHVPIMEDRAGLHTEFFLQLLEQAKNSTEKLIIFDRLHFTQAVRAGVNIAEYAEIEGELLSQNSRVIYLYVEESAIKARVEYAAQYPREALATEHSAENWGEYIRRKGQTLDEIAAYYAAQQRTLTELLAQSKLPSQMFDTTNHAYAAIANQIVQDLVAD